MTTKLPHNFRPNGGCMDCGAPANTTTKTCDEYRDAGKMIAYKCTRCGATYEIAENIWFKRCKCGGTCEPIQPTTKGGDEPCADSHALLTDGAQSGNHVLIVQQAVTQASASNPAAVESNPPGDAGKRAICNACGEYTEDCRCGPIHATPATDTPMMTSEDCVRKLQSQIAALRSENDQLRKDGLEFARQLQDKCAECEGLRGEIRNQAYMEHVDVVIGQDRDTLMAELETLRAEVARLNEDKSRLLKTIESQRLARIRARKEGK